MVWEVAIKCCLMLGSVTASTQDMGMKMHNIYTRWYCTKWYHKGKGLKVSIRADMKESEECGIAAAKGNQIVGLIRRNIVYKEK